LQSFELISVKRCQSDTCRQTAMPRALQHVRHARVAPYTPYRRLSARARTRAFPRPTSRLPKVQRPEDERPKAAPDPSAMGVCALRVEPARARTPFCRAAGVPPGRCPWLAFPSVPPRLRPWWTSPIKRPERSRVHRAAPCHHRSATGPPRCVHPSASSPHRSVPPIACLAPTQARTAAGRPGRARPSPGSWPLWLAPAIAAEPPRRHPSTPTKHTNRSLESPYSSSPPSPAKGAARAAQFRRVVPANSPKDPIAFSPFFPGS
jgi:hypothetical protein